MFGLRKALAVWMCVLMPERLRVFSDLKGAAHRSVKQRQEVFVGAQKDRPRLVRPFRWFRTRSGVADLPATVAHVKT